MNPAPARIQADAICTTQALPQTNAAVSRVAERALRAFVVLTGMVVLTMFAVVVFFHNEPF
jgi:hypothetical protein